MRQLPCAGDDEDDKLNEGPSHDACVGGLGLISEFGLTFLEMVLACNGLVDRFT